MHMRDSYDGTEALGRVAGRKNQAVDGLDGIGINLLLMSLIGHPIAVVLAAK